MAEPTAVLPDLVEQAIGDFVRCIARHNLTLQQPNLPLENDAAGIAVAYLGNSSSNRTHV
jgi:hypothetical protein